MNKKQEYYSLHYKGKKGKRQGIYLEQTLSFFDALQLVKYKDTFEEIKLNRGTVHTFLVIENNTHKAINCTVHSPAFMSVKEYNTDCCENRSSRILNYFLLKQGEKVTFLYQQPPKQMNKAIKEPKKPYELVRH
ncbi:hypothetical protein JMM81_06635 [Bacillus sp. V3B]|uniref:hypothetical protein n=1 Tax=Bacillus sp. V3B TaxID=2804915 RepID=UPI00210BFB29|nr:hypothetical protein [Bacillus sp. V3B]MCQ6274650.1 hypothetical protein [Bacillus sp. V3B]